MGTIIPTNSVEFETLTTEPAYGDPQQFDTNPFIMVKDGVRVERPVPEHWRLLAFQTRDIRLGNISHMWDDIEYLEDRLGLTAALLHLRNGSFEDLAPLSLGQVAATIELSQSRGGFFRKNARTFHSVSEQTENLNTGQTSFFGKLFGQNKGSGVK